MSDIDRAELRKLLAEATPGPWVVKVRHELSYIPLVFVSKLVPVPRKDAEGYLVGIKHEPDVIFVGQDADVPLIAAAVNSLPGLLDALERAEGYRDSLAATLIEVQREKRLLDERVRGLHKAVEIEPSGTICDECSNRLPNGRYMPVVEYPCATILALDGGE